MSLLFKNQYDVLSADDADNEEVKDTLTNEHVEVVRPVKLVMQGGLWVAPLTQMSYVTGKHPHSCTIKMSHIIQWNYRGLKINLIELSPVRTFFPVAFGLQEIPTVLPLNSQQSPVTFTMALIKSKLTSLLLTLPAALKETDQIQLKN